MAPHRRWNDSCRTRISYVAIALAFGLTVSGSGKSLLRACLPLRDLTKLSCPAQCASTRGLLTAPLTAQRIMSPVRCGVQESGVPARTPWRLSPPMQYDRVFPVAIPGELHIPPFCALSGWRPRFPLPCIRRISRVGTIPSVTMRDRDSRHQAVRGAATRAGHGDRRSTWTGRSSLG
jgi:hypothetical protein